MSGTNSGALVDTCIPFFYCEVGLTGSPVKPCVQANRGETATGEKSQKRSQMRDHMLDAFAPNTCTNTRNEIFDLALVELAKAGRTTRISEVGE